MDLRYESFSNFMSVKPCARSHAARRVLLCDCASSAVGHTQNGDEGVQVAEREAHIPTEYLVPFLQVRMAMKLTVAVAKQDSEA